MCKSLGSRLDHIRPLAGTVEFVGDMERATLDPMFGAGFLGIGNEKMLIPEYTAAAKCFEGVSPDSAHAAFLSANIEEDVGHSMMIERAVRALASLGYDPQIFLDGARHGVDARVRYFDRLCEVSMEPGILWDSLSKN